ncbi:MAG: cold shock domain-containing protein [Boseongicola sp.]|nr:cold shock domain-containing protein [Boseongicola sp.]
MLKGTTRLFNQAKGYGFILSEDDSRDMLVHMSAVKRSGLTALNDGQAVAFELVRGWNGRMAAENFNLDG